MQGWSRLSTAAVGALAVIALIGVSGASANGTAAVAAPLAAAAAQQLAAPIHQAPTENSYVPVTPCRVMDTRGGTGTGGTPFSSLQTRTYYVSGTFGFAPQGGKAGGCGIASGAVAIAVAMTAVSPEHAGRIVAWPNGSTEPGASLLNYSTTTTSTGLTLTINPATAYSLKVRNYGGPTDLVIDILGYYVKPLAAMIHPDGSLYAGSSRAISSTRVSAGVYRIKFDRAVTSCTLSATAYISSYYASADSYSYSANNQVQIEVYNAAGANVDQYVYVVAIC